MPNVVIISDWNKDDYYRVMTEGMLLKLHPDIKIFYPNHYIELHDLMQAGFILRIALFSYPEDTIFIVGINSIADEDKGYLYVNVNERHLFCANNGIIAFIDDIHKKKVYKLPFDETTFAEKDVFIPSIGKLIDDKNIPLGEECHDYQKVKKFYPDFSNNILTGMVIFVDSYGNAITNISRSKFEQCKADRNFIIYPGTKHECIKKISTSYYEHTNDELFAIFNSVDLLELGIFNDNISKLYNLLPRTHITIEFL
ncbi:MAG: SAM-dependent chlorinase/fluorinase [Bacteroidales bacterium]|nr:SAM-dependent chlorinase/fluorinase [Bacteroidales bacterium]